MGNQVVVPPQLQSGLISPAARPTDIADGQPPQEVINAIESGASVVTRRVEIYESDGVTRWYPEGSADEEQGRLVGGSVSVDTTRDERRSVDLVLNNSDNLLRENPYGGFWYDKILKVYRGIKYSRGYALPRIIIIEAADLSTAYDFKGILGQIGYPLVDINLDAATFADINTYDIIISYMQFAPTVKADLLYNAWESGKAVITVGAGNTENEVPLISTSTGTASREYGIDHVAYDSPLQANWTQETYGTLAGGRAVTAMAGPTLAVVTHFDGGVTDYVGIIGETTRGGRWFNLHLPELGSQSIILIQNAIVWLQRFNPSRHWESQIGEFMIDSMDSSNEQKTVHIVGRDYTKKMLLSQIAENESFDPGTNLTDYVIALAANAGIVKMRIPKVDDVVGTGVAFQGGATRWEMIKDPCNNLNYDIYIDRQGYLTMNKYFDPLLSPVDWKYLTGRSGNLVNYSRTVSDGLIFNHIIVTSQPDSNALPFFGEAVNNEPSSPTNIDRIGDRVQRFELNTLGSNSACENWARRMLKVAALESYDISYGSYNYPWREGGRIIEFFDPYRLDFEPVRFLEDTFTLALDLNPQTSTAKRVTFIDDVKFRGQ